MHFNWIERNITYFVCTIFSQHQILENKIISIILWIIFFIFRYHSVSMNWWYIRIAFPHATAFSTSTLCYFNVFAQTTATTTPTTTIACTILCVLYILCIYVYVCRIRIFAIVWELAAEPDWFVVVDAQIQPSYTSSLCVFMCRHWLL